MTIGSSETTREPPFHVFDFEDFLHHHRPSHKRVISQAFLEWLVGFTEGDGSFICRLEGGRPRFAFEITQKDIRPLLKIRAHLGFGRVGQRGAGACKFWVEDARGLQRIMALFNGNLVLPKRRAQFAAWATAASAVQPKDFALRLGGPQISLETGWLAGFLDAEGCFAACLTRPSSRSLVAQRLVQKVHVTQQDTHGERDLLRHIGLLLESEAAVSLVKAPDCYRIEISSLHSHRCLIDYLGRFPLLAKALAYRRWWRIYLVREKKEHVTARGLRKLARLCHSLRKEKT